MTDEKDLERGFFLGNVIFIISVGLAILFSIIE